MSLAEEGYKLIRFCLWMRLLVIDNHNQRQVELECMLCIQFDGVIEDFMNLEMKLKDGKHATDEISFHI